MQHVETFGFGWFIFKFYFGKRRDLNCFRFFGSNFKKTFSLKLNCFNLAVWLSGQFLELKQKELLIYARKRFLSHCHRSYIIAWARTKGWSILCWSIITWILFCVNNLSCVHKQEKVCKNFHRDTQEKKKFSHIKAKKGRPHIAVVSFKVSKLFSNRFGFHVSLRRRAMPLIRNASLLLLWNVFLAFYMWFFLVLDINGIILMSIIVCGSWFCYQSFVVFLWRQKKWINSVDKIY